MQVSDPTVVYLEGYYIAAFANGPQLPEGAGMALSTDGRDWERCNITLPAWKWTFLFVYRDQLYLAGTQGILWERAHTTNDLELVLLSPPPDLNMASPVVRLTEGLGLHSHNLVPLVADGRVVVPVMVALASSRWEPIPVAGFAAAGDRFWVEGLRALEGATPDFVRVGAQDWDRVVFGVRVARPHGLGKHTFVWLQGAASGLYARVVEAEALVLWVVPQLWNTTCVGEEARWACKSTRGNNTTEVGISSVGAQVHPDSPIYQEFFLTYLQSSADSLLDRAAWEMADMVGNPVMLHPEAHRLWAGPSIQERAAGGRLKTCTATGAHECVYWQEPVAFWSRENRTRVAVRLTTDQNCNSAVLCDVGDDGQLDCSQVAPLPGFGNVRGFVLFDVPSGLYWAVNNFNTDTTRAISGKQFMRQGQRCLNERGNMALFYSADLHNWLPAKVLAKSNTNLLHIMYVSCVVVGEDLLCVARTNGSLLGHVLVSPEGDNHLSRSVMSFKIANFRGLVAR